MENFHVSWIEVNLSAVEQNTRTIKKMCNTALMAVVKANAYGHGSLKIAQSVVSAGADALGVTKVLDGIEMRKAGIGVPILVLGSVFPEEIDQTLQYNLTIPLFDRDILRILSTKAKENGKKIPVHLKIDTGLGRFGIFPNEIPAFVSLIRESGGIEIEGVYTHFAMADVKDDPTNVLQANRFKAALKTLAEMNVYPKWIHAASSAGAYYLPETRYNMVRVSESILGMGTGSTDYPYPDNLRRTFAWKSRLISVRQFPAEWGISYGQRYHTKKDEWIGVVPVGHADGYVRCDENVVLINGQRINAVGSVCIDQFMVSLPEPYPVGTEVVLIGKQGDEEITLEELRSRWRLPLTNVPIVDRSTPRVYFYDKEAGNEQGY